ncbi:MAG: cadherin-like beta sandwich domain-containing protein [Oscillospiraceae bacterium]|nr:cadherin-like beta sandwich domain-containing protein [Oscillospiraceae bacterium]
MEKEYTLGSGHIHIQEYTGTLPTNWDEFFASTENILGRVKGGASFEYTTEKYEDQDDLGYVVIEEITKEKVTMKSGMMTWDGETLEKLCSTARIEKLTDGTTRIKIGGLGNQKNSRWVIGFEHKNKNLRVIIVGKNNEGFTFDFKQDSATVIDCLFRSEASDDEGTLILIDDMRTAPVLSSLLVGGLTLTPAFNPYVKNYTASATEATVAITAAAKADGNTVEIKNGETKVENGKTASLSQGSNTITVSVTDADKKVFTYTVNVNKASS